MASRPKLRRHRQTKIVATLGPASSSEDMIARLFHTGADVFRLNFSHGSHDDHAASVASVRALEATTGRPIGLLADVQGPKLRIGRFGGGRVHLQTGQKFRLDMDPSPGGSRRVQLPHPEILAAASSGTTLLLDDGKLRLRVEHNRGGHLDCEVMAGGALSDRKGVNVPDILLQIPALTAKDRLDLAFALEQGVDFIGLSFVQRPEDVAEARAIAGGRAWIVSKIEKPQALDQLEAIVELSDAVMVARGDLGVELPPEEVPLAQKRIIRTARAFGKPVIVATQMLESMINAPAPTRAEASDVAGAVFDGTDAVMLSAETAAGQFPVEAVAMMDRIVTRVEQDQGWRTLMDASRQATGASSSDAIAAAASDVARSIGARAIAAFTASGATALRISRERPTQAILGIVTEAGIARRLALSWGVHAVLAADTRTMADAVLRAARIAREEGFAKHGEPIVVAGGIPFGTAGTTNSLRVTTVK
jgi:pyruvate kinase